jgi:hypothetical protein
MSALLSVIVLTASTLAPLSSSSASPLCSDSSAPVEQAKRPDGFMTKATCTALCGSSPSVTCTGSTCSAVNQSCTAQQGYVVCDGSYTFCPACTCTEGAIKIVNVGPTCGCEDGLSTPKERYKCIGGEWVYQSSFCGAPFCHEW